VQLSIVLDGWHLQAIGVSSDELKGRSGPTLSVNREVPKELISSAWELLASAVEAYKQAK
jgi:hypothetical protein